MSEGMNPLEIERILDFVIALFPEEKYQVMVGEHIHNESKVDQAIRLIEGSTEVMNIAQVIKVVHCGYPSECISDDRISIEFSPNELSSLGTHFKEHALRAGDYSTQTEMRKMHEAFDRAHDMWIAYLKRVNK